MPSPSLRGDGGHREVARVARRQGVAHVLHLHHAAPVVAVAMAVPHVAEGARRVDVDEVPALVWRADRGHRLVRLAVHGALEDAVAQARGVAEHRVVPHAGQAKHGVRADVQADVACVAAMILRLGDGLHVAIERGGGGGAVKVLRDDSAVGRRRESVAVRIDGLGRQQPGRGALQSVVGRRDHLALLAAHVDTRPQAAGRGHAVRHEAVAGEHQARPTAVAAHVRCRGIQGRRRVEHGHRGVAEGRKTLARHGHRDGVHAAGCVADGAVEGGRGH